MNCIRTHTHTHTHTRTHAHLLFYFCQAPINNSAFHWSCLHGSGSVELSSPSRCQLHRLVHLCKKKIKYFICRSVFNQRSVTSVSLWLSWFLSLLSLWLYFMPCVSLTLAGSCWGLFMWRSDVCRVGEIFHMPFGKRWPSTIKAGTISQV